MARRLGAAALCLAALALVALTLAFQFAFIPAAWVTPVKPFAISDEVAYVGTEDLAAYLIDTGSGLILIDAPAAQNASLVEANIRTLGHKLSDVKILLNTHAHFDHAGGLAELKRATGARLLASKADGALIAAGGRGDFHYGNWLVYPPVTPDGVLNDGDTVILGTVTLTAHLTPGHTKGCTSWTMTAHVKGRPAAMLLSCSVSSRNYDLHDEPAYPGMIAAYRASLAKLKSLPCDMFLAPHGSQFGLSEKRAALAAHPETNPFVGDCRQTLDGFEAAFDKQLAEEQAKAAH